MDVHIAEGGQHQAAIALHHNASGARLRLRIVVRDGEDHPIAQHQVARGATPGSDVGQHSLSHDSCVQGGRNDRITPPMGTQRRRSVYRAKVAVNTSASATSSGTVTG